MVIVVANEKGGSGKTTLALNLACFCAEDGDTITLLDADPQKSTETFSNNRSDSGLKPLFSNIFKAGSSLKDEINLQYEKNDGIIVDTGGRDSKEMRIAISKADLLIIPTIASQLDVVVLEKMLEVFSQAKDINQDLKALIVFNKISPNPFLSKDIDELKEFVQNAIKTNDLEDVFIADSMIYERRIYKKIIETGQSLREFCKEDDKALLEFQSFFNEVLSIANIK